MITRGAPDLADAIVDEDRAPEQAKSSARPPMARNNLTKGLCVPDGIGNASANHQPIAATATDLASWTGRRACLKT
jgi:hypothetical protein